MLTLVFLRIITNLLPLYKRHILYYVLLIIFVYLYVLVLPL
jgi:hypothetical protein